ncbi:MAG: hypothetical protein IKM18_07365 [Clostridia bacterium]|nr:hypothetical protein [Clostridia bacterium]
MSKKDGFYLYFDWEKPFDRLDDESLGKITRAMVKYVKHGEEPPEFNGNAALVADFVFPQLARSIQYAENGAKGGKKTQSKPTVEPMVEPTVEPLNIDINSNINPNIDVYPHPLPKRGKQASYDAGFEEFWKVYPKKQSKQAALKAWEKLKPDSDLTREIIEAVQARCRTQEWKDQNGKFVPLPASYLNQQRWTDEITKINSIYSSDLFGELPD